MNAKLHFLSHKKVEFPVVDLKMIGRHALLCVSCIFRVVGWRVPCMSWNHTGLRGGRGRHLFPHTTWKLLRDDELWYSTKERKTDKKQRKKTITKRKSIIAFFHLDYGILPPRINNLGIRLTISNMVFSYLTLFLRHRLIALKVTRAQDFLGGMFNNFTGFDVHHNFTKFCKSLQKCCSSVLSLNYPVSELFNECMTHRNWGHFQIPAHLHTGNSVNHRHLECTHLSICPLLYCWVARKIQINSEAKRLQLLLIQQTLIAIPPFFRIWAPCMVGAVYFPAK